VYVDSHNRLWMATEQLAVRLDLETGTRQTFPWQSRNPRGPLAIGEDREGRSWVSDETNLYCFQKGRWVAAKDSGGGPITDVRNIKREDSSNLWALSRQAFHGLVKGKPEFATAGGDFSSAFLVSSTKGKWFGMLHGGPGWPAP
jgi:hypothetical protein